MARSRYQVTKFTIQDINNWLKGDQEAAKKVWIESRFINAMSYNAQKKARLHLNASNWSTIKENYYDNIESIAYDTIVDVSMYIKNNKKSFENVSKFIAYVNKTSYYRLVDKLNKILNEIRKKEELIDPPTTYNNFKDCETSKTADKLLNDFENSNNLQTKDSLRERLVLLKKLSNGSSLEVIAFLLTDDETNEISKELRKEAQKNEEYQQDTWSSYNRRLKAILKKYIQSEKGKKQLFSLKEGYIN